MGRYQGLKTYDEADLSRALDCIHEPPPDLDRAALRDRAVALFEALGRMTWIDAEGASPPPEGARLHAWDVSGVAHRLEPGRGPVPAPLVGELSFVRIDAGEPGSVPNWRLDPSVLEAVPAWRAALQGVPLRGDVARDLDRELGGLPPLERMGHAFRSALPERLAEGHLLLDTWQWLLIALLVAVGVVLGRVVGFVVRLATRRVERSERLSVDRAVLLGFERPFSLWFSAWFLLWTLPMVQLEASVYEVVRLAVALFLAFGGVWSAYRLVDVLAAIVQARADRTRNRFDDMLVPLLRRTLKALITVVGVVYVASYLSEDLYGIVAGLSIGSLAVGFAAKDSIENMFGTATVLMDKPYQLGDWVTLDGIDGTVEAVGFRSTRIRTFQNSLITVPNSRFIRAATENWGARRYRRIKFTVSLAYGTPSAGIEAFCEGVRELVRQHPYTRKDYYHVYLNELGPASLDVLVYCFVETPDWATELRERHRLLVDVLKVAEGLGVEIAFPTQTVHLRGLPHEAAEPAGADAPLDRLPADAEGARGAGRELAGRIAAEGLAAAGGEPPPPVRFP
jgi:MscS family membrane protein